MDIKVVVGDITEVAADAIVVNLFQGVTAPGGATGAVDTALDGALSDLIADGEITGKKGTAVIHTLGKMPTKRVVVAGLGKQDGFDVNTIRDVAGDAARYLRGLGVKKAATILHGAGIGGIDPEAAAAALAEGTLLGLYAFRHHMSGDNGNHGKPEELAVMVFDPGNEAAVQRGIDTGRIMAEAAALARDLANQPANEMTPTRLALHAEEVATQHGLDFRVLERSDCAELGMGAFLGVAQGSVEPPKFIICRYNGDPNDPDNNLGIIGKSITFDSGGISLKGADGMGRMKADMSGGASVIGAMHAIGQLKPRLNVTMIAAATENMPSGSATRPGDILKSMSGKTIEVDNTDAEGRLTLGDAQPPPARLATELDVAGAAISVRKQPADDPSMTMTDLALLRQFGSSSRRPTIFMAHAGVRPEDLQQLHDHGVECIAVEAGEVASYVDAVRAVGPRTVRRDSDDLAAFLPKTDDVEDEDED